MRGLPVTASASRGPWTDYPLRETLAKNAQDNREVWQLGPATVSAVESPKALVYAAPARAAPSIGAAGNV